ncbi:MAG TPA: class I SAM-dependent methyltransferase [Xanthobacteraceae bacterium]
MIPTGGYVADIAYTAGFYPETAPAHMAFAALCRRRSPGLALRPRRVIELGFGQGFGLALLAAANPDATFEGCDFNGEHVAHARGLIEGAQLQNLAVTQASFEEIAARGGDRDVDVAILHGVMSWISRTGQDAALAILRERLRPNGLAYVSYNCMPGWAPLMPIRQLTLEVKRRNPGASEQQLALALDLLGKLWQANAGYLTINPVAAHHVGTMLAGDRLYLAHEYLTEHGDPPAFSAVASLLQQADLAYAASADVLDSFDQYAVPPGTLPVIAQIADPVLRETVRDFAANRRFRRDLFARGVTELSPDQQRGLLSPLRFALAVSRSRMAFRFLGPVSELTLKPAFHGMVADLLASRDATFDELLALPAFAENGIASLLDCLALLVYSGQVRVLVDGDRVDLQPAQRFNRLIVEHARAGRFYGYLASPVARSGVPVDELGLLALAAHFDGEAPEPETAARHALSILKALGRRPMRDNKHVADDGEAVAFLCERMQAIFAEEFPLWRRLGVR